MKTGRHVHAKQGYSLVEISLAMLVAAMGIMAVFALFPTSLDASRRSVDATEVSAFAQWVFANLDNAATRFNWGNFGNGSVNLQECHALAFPQTILESQGNSAVQVCRWKPGYYGQWAYLDNYDIVQFTYTLNIGNDPYGDTRIARLEVWPGDVQDAVVSAKSSGTKVPGSTVFYRQFFPPDA